MVDGGLLTSSGMQSARSQMRIWNGADTHNMRLLMPLYMFTRSLEETVTHVTLDIVLEVGCKAYAYSQNRKLLRYGAMSCGNTHPGVR